MTSNTELMEKKTATATAERKATQKAHTRARRANVAPARAKSSKKANPARKAHKTASKAKGTRPGKGAKQKGVREGSKTAKILALLDRPGGATAKELMKVTGWQSHSVRGFLSGTVGKKMGLSVESAKRDGGERTYTIKG